MPCEQPRRISNPKYRGMSDFDRHEYSLRVFGSIEPPDRYIDVPCGWCFSCQRLRLASYNLRLKYEFRDYPDNTYFVTLTFDEDNLRRFAENPNKSVLLFLDRYRKRAGKQVRHFFVSEYGERKGRLHYHGLLFNAPITEEEEIKSLWKYGFIDIQKADINSADYVTKYLTKGTDVKRPSYRVISSKGIGKGFLNDFNKSSFIVDNEIKPILFVNGRALPIPRYYYSHLFDDEDKLKMLVNRYVTPFVGYVAGHAFTNVDDYRRALKGLHYEHLRLDLSPLHKPPTTKKKSKQSKLLTIKNNYFYG